MTSNRAENKGQRRPFRLPGPTLTKEQFMILWADPELPAQPVRTELSFIDPAADRLWRSAVDPGDLRDRQELFKLVGLPRTHDTSSLLGGQGVSSPLLSASVLRVPKTHSRADRRASKRTRLRRPLGATPISGRILEDCRLEVPRVAPLSKSLADLLSGRFRIDNLDIAYMTAWLRSQPTFMHPCVVGLLYGNALDDGGSATCIAGSLRQRP